MPRKSIDRSTPSTGNVIDMKTGKLVEKAAIPVICERIRYYRERMGIEQKELASRIGITGNAISNWENGRTRPDINLLPSICEVLNISLYELFDVEDPTIQYTAREQLLIENYQHLTDGHKRTVDVLVKTLLNVQSAERCRTVRKIVFFSKSLAAGVADPCEFEDEGEPIFLYASEEVDKSDCVFTVNGNSMEPEYHNGDMVLVQRTPDAPPLQYGEVGAFITGNETYIKVYEEDGLHSLNPKYKTLHFTDDNAVYLIGRVIGVLDPSQIATQEDVETYESLHPGEFDDD